MSGEGEATEEAPSYEEIEVLLDEARGHIDWYFFFVAIGGSREEGEREASKSGRLKSATGEHDCAIPSLFWNRIARLNIRIVVQARCCSVFEG